LDPAGRLLYCNPATDRLLEEMGLAAKAVENLLPENYIAWIRRAMETHQGDDIEVTRQGRTFRFGASPLEGGSAVLVTGVELTALKQLQAQLREANEKLEESVAVRTYELLLTQDVTIMTLATLAESRDPVTGAHLARTRNYVRILAEHLVDHPRFKAFFSGDHVIDKLYRSAPLHDIGKVGERDDILLKPGKLSAEEYEQMKNHTTIGGDALRWAQDRLGSDSFLQYAREIAYYHHEKWDGSGYPNGLAGEDIPISARLMALADVYDALTNERCYKPAYPHEMARGHILAGKGSHFDPAVVDAFLDAEDEFKEIADGKVDPMV
jgi:putative two-component system response regulator